MTKHVEQMIKYTETLDAADELQDALAELASGETMPERRAELEELTVKALRVVLRIQSLGRTLTATEPTAN